METNPLRRLCGLALGLGVFLVQSSQTIAIVVPTPPALDWTTDGGSTPDSTPWPADVIPQTLGVWSFDSPTQLSGFRADPPRVASNLFLIPSPWGNALRLASDAPASIRFGVRQSNTNADFSVRNGTVSLWLRPEWSAGGPTAPAAQVPLVEVGTNSAARTGWWAWLISPGGGELQFVGQARGQQVTWIRKPVTLVSNQWTHLALTWSPSQTSLYIDGVPGATGSGVTHWPSSSDRESSGWGVGGDRSGMLRVPGAMDTLFTANHPLSAAEIRRQFETAVATQHPVSGDPSSTPFTLSAAGIGTPSRPSSFRSGLWIEAALERGTGTAGGWLHSTLPGLGYELFAAREPGGPWLLDQNLTGAVGQSWTGFTLNSPIPLPWFAQAAPFADADQDGLSDESERLVSRTNPGNADTDNDGMPDGWEVQYGLDPRKDDGLADTDGDGMINALEYLYRRNPAVANPLPLVSVRTTATTIREGASTGKFVLKRTGSTAEALEVNVEFTGPSVNGLDYTRLPGRVAIAAGRSELELTVNPLVDGQDEADESVILTIKRGALYGSDSTPTAQMVIQDVDLPSVSIRATDPDAGEPEFGRTNPGEFEVQRSGLIHLPLVVGLRAAVGTTVVAGTDAQGLPPSVTLPAGETRAFVSVNPINNRKLTGPKLLKAEIIPSATAYTVESGKSVATVTIADIEPLLVTVVAEDPMAEEKLSGIGRFKFVRAGGSARPLTIFYHIGGTAQSGTGQYSTHPADYEALPGFVTIPAGGNEAWVDVKPIPDTLLETLETVEVTIAGSLDYSIGTANSATVTIDDSNPAKWSSQLIRPTSVAGSDGPEGLIEITRFGTVLTDMTLPYKVSGQRILKPSGTVLSFDDPLLRTLGASYMMTVTGGRLGPTAGTLLVPKGVVRMTVGLKATLPSAEVKGATLILAPGSTLQEVQPVQFLDRWNLVSIQPTAEHVVEGGQVALKITAAAADPAAVSGTTVRFMLLGTANPDSDVTLTGASATGVDDTGAQFVDVAIPAKPPAGSTVRSATLIIKATADGKVEKTPNLLILRYRPDQLASALGSAQQARPYAPIQIRDSTSIALPPLDCDQDGFPDSFESDHDMDPLTPSLRLTDEDRDGILDLEELRDGTRYDAADSDADGIPDFIEKLLGINPLVADPHLAGQVREMVPVRLRTSGVLRAKEGTCYQCHAPGMKFGDVEMMGSASNDSSPTVMLTRNLLLAPGQFHTITLAPPPSYKANSSQFKTYSAEVLPIYTDRPTGFVIVESDPSKPLLGQTVPIDSATFTTRKATLRVLKKPLMAVDRDRDGTIRFDATDGTTPERPYRFWVNNDNDISTGTVEPEKLDSTVQDHSDGSIRNMRDLEDFTRLWIDLQGLQTLPSSQKIELAFEWRNVTEGAPAIQLYNSVEADGGLRYLNEVATASQQSLPNAVLPGFAYAIVNSTLSTRRIEAGSRFILPIGTWSGGANLRHFLFEAAARGRGDLVLMLVQNGKTLAESAPLHLHLLDIKEMYTRVQATPRDGFLQPYRFGLKYPESVTFGVEPMTSIFSRSIDPERKPLAITFIHGWNMTESEAVAFSETSYKRLWHSGYRGELQLFKWPTGTLSKPEFLDQELYDSFNFSEHRAWLYGASLKMAVESQPQGYKRIVASHSMGAILTISALQSGMRCDTAIIMQGAVSASVFDTNPKLNNPRLTAAESAAPKSFKTPDQFATELGYRGMLLNPSCRLINYYNKNDFALQTGSYVLGLIEANWLINQIKEKPSTPTANGRFEYGWIPEWKTDTTDSRAQFGPRQYLDDLEQDRSQSQFYPWRTVSESAEVLAFIARSRTKAVGAEDRTNGALNTDRSFDLESFGVGRDRGDHSGQFRRTIQETSALYTSFLESILSE